MSAPDIPSDVLAVLAELLGPTTELTAENLARAGEAVVKRLKDRHRGFHADAIRGGLIVKAFRSTIDPETITAGNAEGSVYSWRKIDQRTGIPQRTAGRWMKLAEEYLADPTTAARAVENWKLS